MKRQIRESECRESEDAEVDGPEGEGLLALVELDVEEPVGRPIFMKRLPSEEKVSLFKML